MQQGKDCDPTTPRQPVLYLTENQFLSACSLARLGTAVHPTLGMGEMRLEAQDETNNGLSGIVENSTLENAIG